MGISTLRTTRIKSILSQLNQKKAFIKMSPKKLSESAVHRLAKGCRDFAEEDLKIAKDFEQVENELDEECGA